MKLLGALAFTWMAALLAATPAAAEFVDFTNLGTTDGEEIFTYDAFPTAFVDFDVHHSLGSGGASTSDFVLYSASPNYSGSAALYSPTDSDYFHLAMTPQPGRTITGISFDLGGLSDTTAHYGIFGNFFNLLDEDDVSISGTTGGLVSLSGISVSSIIFQFTGTGVGIRSLSFTTVATSAATPIPGALLLFGTGLTGLGVLARRKRHAKE
jgi:hypothetical protein